LDVSQTRRKYGIELAQDRVKVKVKVKIKIKLSLSLTKHHAMKVYWRVEV